MSTRRWSPGRIIPWAIAAVLGIGVVFAAQTNFLGTVFIADSTVPTQQLAINADGSINTTPGGVSSSGLTPGQSTAAEANRVLKASAGTLFSVEVTTSSAAGYVLVFNATSAPVDGAVTPIKCWYVAAAPGSLVRDFRPVPITMSTGITVSFSTTGCFTKTASATAFISGEFQ